VSEVDSSFKFVKMSNFFLKLALLTGDDLAILLASEKYKNRRISKGPKFCFDSYEPERCKRDFRFNKSDISRLMEAFQIPPLMKTKQGLTFKGIEGNFYCIL
jgi:hypothetical protein